MAKNVVVSVTSFTRNGRESISNGSSSVNVSFTPAFADTNYSVNCNIQNTVDATPSVYAYTITAKTTSSFSVEFSGVIDSANYILNWTAST